MPYEPQNLRRWTYDGPTAFDSASNYAGPDLTHLWIGPVSQTRDSGPLDRSNFAVVSKELEKIGDDWDREHDWDGEGDPAVAIHRFGHWGPGWYEIILIRADCESALRRADEWVASLADYPVADEIHLSEIEFEETHEAWMHLPLSERIELCASDGISIFAARHDWVPSEESGRIQEHLLGY